MAKTDITSTPSTSQASKNFKLPKFDWKLIEKNLGIWIWKFLKTLGRTGAGAIILFALAHFVPELREEMPNFYRLIDFIIDAIEWVYTQFWAIIS